MGFGEYLDQIIRSHLTVAESTELTIKVSCFFDRLRRLITLCTKDSTSNRFLYKYIHPYNYIYLVFR